jgi:sulfur carrier protein
MNVIVNGEAFETFENSCINDLILSLNLNAEGVIVMINETVIKQYLWKETLLEEGDRIELVSLIGGG